MILALMSEMRAPTVTDSEPLFRQRNLSNGHPFSPTMTDFSSQAVNQVFLA